ncbi:MAG: hypothetical protein EXS05_15715 [Planctomycetaceae bacterium]|nr:hypothetical protein [Planctomycetaceae bacterium]
MSRSRKAHPKPPATIAPAAPPRALSSGALSGSAALLPTPGQRLVVWLAIGAALFWTAWLAVMGMLTANPTAVSSAQVGRADAVVIARLIDPAHNRLRIERALSGKLAAGDVVTVLNFSDIPNVSGEQSYLVPLSFFRDDYLVTVLEGQHAPPLIYPAIPETIEKAKGFVREGK